MPFVDSIAAPPKNLTLTTPGPLACVGEAHEDHKILISNYLSGHEDSATAAQNIQRAINDAVSSSRGVGDTVLLFDAPGGLIGFQYRVAAPNASSHTPIFIVTGASGPHRLRIDGCGSRLLVTTVLNSLWSISDSNFLSVGNFTDIDFDPLPITQGRVIEEGPSSIEYTIQLEDGYPSLNEPHFLKTLGGGWGVGGAAWAIVKDPQEPIRPKVDSLNLIKVKNWTLIAPRVFKVTLLHCNDCNVCSGCTLSKEDWELARPKKGDPIVHVARY